MAKNLTSYFQDAATTTARNAEYTGTPLTDVAGDGTTTNPYLGCNAAGGNSPGIGICTGFIDPKLTDWSVVDQAEAARTPQNSQHIGGSGLGAGDADNEPVRFIVGADVNDTANYLAATAQAAPDAIFDATTGAVNKTSVTVEIGDVLWGPVPVA